MTDPWEQLAKPAAASTVTALRVDAQLPWGFFWARDLENKCLLVLRYSSGLSTGNRLPRLEGIEITDLPDERGAERILALRLADSAQRDIFHQLCLDIMASAARAANEEEALHLVLSRTWRWHHLLRGGKDDRLSAEEQKGLIGELLVLERFLLPAFAARDAVRMWHGPLGAPKDFEVGKVWIEAKARRGAATPFISISSEFQLDDTGSDALFLHVIDLNQAGADGNGSFTVADVAQRVAATVRRADADAGDALDGLLTAMGFEWSDDYSDFAWIEGDTRVYKVGDGFPRITPDRFPAGVSRVTYSIELPDCDPFGVLPFTLQDVLAGEAHGI